MRGGGTGHMAAKWKLLHPGRSAAMLVVRSSYALGVLSSCFANKPPAAVATAPLLFLAATKKTKTPTCPDFRGKENLDVTTDRNPVGGEGGLRR